MKTLITLFLIFATGITISYTFQPVPSSAVALVGGSIRARHIEKEEKYPRKDCPVCEGKGWYISGDGIKKVDCGYCEPEKKSDYPKTIIIEK
jgi:hypothetical protein